MSDQILPGATLGILGSGQLGRMFAIAARRLGYGVHVYSPEQLTPTGQVADREFVAEYSDDDSLREFARTVQVVTYEFENVPAHVSDVLEETVPVRPGPELLHVSQNRIREKGTLRRRGYPVPEFREVHSADDLAAAIAEIGTPSVLKTATSGYDGKGQVLIKDPAQQDEAWTAIGQQPSILEAWVEFDCEVSIVAARAQNGDVQLYGPIRNVHRNHILDVSSLPALVSAECEREAVQVARQFVEDFQVVGVVCLEFFALHNGHLLINEIAPRPHNSGHLTIEACVSCQFEQQVRGICGLPLGDARVRQPAAMANLLGDLWVEHPQGHPDWSNWAGHRDVKLHLYGKHEPRGGRKMGHLTAVAETPAMAIDRVTATRESLRPQDSRSAAAR